MYDISQSFLEKVQNLHYEDAYKETLKLIMEEYPLKEGQLRNMIRNYHYITGLQDIQVAHANALNVYSKIVFEYMSKNWPQILIEWFTKNLKLTGMENLKQSLEKTETGVLIMYQHLGILSLLVPAVAYAVHQVLGKNNIELCSINKASDQETKELKSFYNVFTNNLGVENDLFLSNNVTMEYVPLMMKRNLSKGGISFISNDVNFPKSKFVANFLKRKMHVGWGAAWLGQNVDVPILPANLLFHDSNQLELVFKEPVKLKKKDGLEHNIKILLNIAEQNILENLTQWLYLDRIHRWGEDWVGVEL